MARWFCIKLSETMLSAFMQVSRGKQIEPSTL